MAHRKYTCTNQTNSNTRPFELSISRFTQISGDTTSTVASINTLTVTHYHTATGSKSHKWTCWVVMTFNNGVSITSNEVTHSTGEDSNLCPAWVNTFSNVNAANVQSGIASIEIQATENSGNYSLYWRASSTYPITIDLDFGTYVPTQPKITSAQFTNGNDLYVGANSPIFSHSETYDSNATSVTRTLRLYNSSGFDVYTTIPSTSPVTLSPIGVSGAINWVYTVSDSFGQSVSTNGSVTVKPYYSPSIRTFTVKRADGDNTTAQISVYATSNVGTLKTIKILRWAEGSSTKTYVLNITNYTSNSYQNSNITTSGLTAGSRYYFELTVDDGIQSSVERQIVNGTSALFSIEKNGVAVGKIASRGTTSTPNFEVAMPSFFTELATFSDIQYAPRSTYVPTITKNGFKGWTSWAGNLVVARIGPYVYMYGGILATADVPYESDGFYYIGQIATLPTIYRPNSMVGFTQIVDGTDICIKIEVRPDGPIILRSNKASGPFPNGRGFLMTGNWIASSSFSS